MKWFGAVSISLLLVGLSNSYVITPAVELNGLEHGLKPPYINNDTLVFAHVIYRHGEESTINKELTNEGKRQSYSLGQYFRRRYGKIIGDKYSPDKVYVLSTDHDRAIMSAEANLAGLYYPTSDELWNEEIMWQPVPVHTIPQEKDNLLYGTRLCPKHKALYNYYMTKSPEAVEAMEKYGHLISYWSDMKGEKLDTIEQVLIVYKNYLSDQRQKMQIPEWALSAIKPNEPMEHITKLVYKLRARPELARLRSGFLIKEMLERFGAKINSTLRPDRTLWMYSAHSSTVTTLLNGMGFSQQDIPPNGFSLQFELYKTTDNDHYLQIYLRKPGEEYPEPMYIPGCGVNCPLDKFYAAFERIIPGDFETECKLDDKMDA